jgi:WD40 repeat protein
VVTADGKVWDVSLRRELCQLSSLSRLRSASSLHDGRRVVLVSDKYGGGSLLVSDVLSGRECRRFGVSGDVLSAKALGGGRELLSGHRDGMLRRWDVETGREICRRRGGARSVESMCSLSSGHVVVGCIGPSMRVLDVASLGESFTQELPERAGMVSEVLR